MDAQGIDGCFLFPTLGVGMEESLSDDLPRLVAAFGAFNRWLDDDWGYGYRERIFAAPMMTLSTSTLRWTSSTGSWSSTPGSCA